MDWRALRDAVERGEHPDPPRWRLPVRGWLLEFAAYPKSTEARTDKSFPMIGLYPGQAAWQGQSSAIVRAKIDGKATHYGDVDAPLVVALHDLTTFASHDVVQDALFGLESPYWREGPRSRNRVSAILAASDFGMSSPARKTPELWLNPYARHPLPPGLMPWPVVGAPHASPQMPLDPAALFDLPRDWPGRPFQRS